MTLQLAKNGGVQPLLAVLGGQPLSPPPIWLMRQAGRYLPEYRQVRSRFDSFLELCYSPEWACEVTLQPLRRFGFDAAILFSDILVVPDALGQAVRFEAGEGPRLDPVRRREEIARLTIDHLPQRLAPVFEAATRARAALPPEVSLIGFCGAPWTVATYMVAGGGTAAQEPARRLAYEDPETFAGLIDLLVEASVAHLAGQVRAGTDAVQIFDTWAGVLSDHEFSRWVVDPTRRIVTALRQAVGTAPVIGFPRGAGVRARRYLEETGVDAIGLDWTVPLDYARTALQSRAPVQGNLDPLALLSGGRALDDGVERIVEALGAGPLIFNLGHGILPDTPIAHVERMVERVRRRR